MLDLFRLILPKQERCVFFIEALLIAHKARYLHSYSVAYDGMVSSLVSPCNFPTMRYSILSDLSCAFPVPGPVRRKLTGNDTYRQLAEKSVRHIAGLADPFPGLAPQCIDPSTGQFTCSLVVSDELQSL